ncbi:hypothetical protein GSI_13371 [Ganoderma sinense ZZ0214-1]|uniref:F-box domain-containing protein n=1 Tax=Ganoderma sinense ZZ0214-1 TaxID=1077348 RepID=A0A2G8RVD9_9APHY|nr:hypothetical protein GSI_13371 [Ganoderma sinense ZZ0214-1]
MLSSSSSSSLISGSPSTLPYRPPSSTIARVPELGSVVSLRRGSRTFTATALANHLPYELVVKILSSGAYTGWQELVALTHVCQHWRDVALGTPQLWVDAVRSVFAGPCRWFGPEIRSPKSLSIFLSRSEPLPLTIDFPDHTYLITELSPGSILEPHISRLAHLSDRVRTPGDLQEVLWHVPKYMPNLESLHISQTHPMSGDPFPVLKTPLAWDDVDLPHLHTLSMPGNYFNRSIAVASLNTLVLYNSTRSHDVFVDALKRCAPSLESLTLCDWSHPDAPDSTAGPVQFPRLRRLEVSLPRALTSTTPPPAVLFTTLALPPDVAVDLNWRTTHGKTLELLPKHLMGLHAPPFFDSMCLHFSWPSSEPYIAALHGYVSGTEKLCIQEVPVLDLDLGLLGTNHYVHNTHHPSSISSSSSDSGILGRFPDGHQWPSVTRLAVDLDLDGPSYNWG